MKQAEAGMKYAVITGASGGIGQAISERLWQEGWSLLLIARDGQRLAALRQQLCALSPERASQLAWLALDITQPEAASELKQFLLENQQSLDLLVNAAGCQHFAWLEEQAEAIMRQQVELDLLAPMRLTRALLPAMTPSSTVVNIGSTFGAIGYPGFSVYCASKAGLHAFSEALAREVGPNGPRICLLAPRATATELNHGAVDAMNRALGTQVDTPARVADELMALLAGRQRRRFIGWPEKLFVWLNGLFPALVDRAIGAQREQIHSFAQRPALRLAVPAQPLSSSKEHLS